jgi:hypothetical protein
MADVPTWTTVADVTDRWLKPLGPFPITDSQTETLIGDAEDTILREFPDVPARITDGSLSVRTVKKVVAQMIIRLLRNPEARRQISRVTGPYTDSITNAGDNLGEMPLTEDDRRNLAARSSVRQVFSVYPVSRTVAPGDFGG